MFFFHIPVKKNTDEIIVAKSQPTGHEYQIPSSLKIGDKANERATLNNKSENVEIINIFILPHPRSTPSIISLIAINR